MLNRRDLIARGERGLAAGGTVSAAARSAQAVKKPARLIVGFPAGGGTDITARILAERLRGSYAATVLVENKAGASARLAVEYVKTAEPDGSVMLFTPEFPMTLYPHSFKSLSYDPVRDFIAVGTVARSMLTFNVGPAVPASVTTLRGFVDWCKANPDKSAYATTSAGATPHFVGVMLSTGGGTAMSAVHYRGGAPALQDLVGGHVPSSVNPITRGAAARQGRHDPHPCGDRLASARRSRPTCRPCASKATTWWWTR